MLHVWRCVLCPSSALLHTPGVCKRVHPLDLARCVCESVFAVQRGRAERGRRERAEEPKILTATESSKAPPLFLSLFSLSLYQYPSPCFLSPSLSRSLCCEFLLIPSPFTSLSVYVSSCPVWVSATPTAYISYPQSCKQKPLMFPHLKGKEREKLQARSKEAKNFPSKFTRIKRRALTINGSQEQMFSNAATPPNIVRLSTVAAAS